MKLSRKQYDLKRIRAEYDSGQSSTTLMKKYGLPETTLLRWLKEFGPMRARVRYSVGNERFFKKINSEANAYFLGYIYADGCVFNGGSRGGKRLVLKAHAQDRDILEKFNECIRSTYPLNIFKNCVRLCVRSDLLFDDLGKYGMSERKTFRVRPPKLKNKLMRHFWRGVVDGDGWISQRTCERRSGKSYTYPNVGVAGTKATCKGFSELFRGGLYLKKGKRSYQSQCSGSRAEALMELLWTGASISGDRKRGRVEQWI